jgi:RNA polymerase sigma-70 factor (ECF subfamily)
MAKLNISGLSLLFSRTDEEAMWQVKVHDDHRAFAQLVDRWEEPIRRLCTRMLGDEHRGEDLKQETFAKLFDKRKLYEPSGRFSTYLWRIALNVCHDDLRRRKRRQEFFPDGDEETDGINEYADAEPTPDITAAGREEAEIVRLALLKLAEPYRTVLVLRHYEGLKIAKIAEILDVPIGTVSSRLGEGLARLTRLLQPTLRGEPVARKTPNIDSREILVI